MTIELLIAQYGTIGVFAASVIEELISFIPSTLVHATAGLLIMGNEPISAYSLGKFFLAVSVPISVGAVIGSLPYYYLFRSGSDKIIDRWGPRIGIKKRDFDLFRSRLRGDWRDNVVFFLARLIPIIPNVLYPVVAGVVRMPLITYIILTLGSVCIRASAIAFIGWQFGRQWEKLAIHPALLGLFTVLGISICWLIFQMYRDYMHKKANR